MKSNYSYKKSWWLMCVILALLMNQQLQAQRKATKNFSNAKLTVPKGTNTYTNIRSSLQSKNGNMWFATTGAGVYRYDGKSFTNFTNKDGLLDNVVYCIFESKDGKIWFGTNNGISIYDGKTFTKFPLPGMEDNSFLPNRKWIDLKGGLSNLNVLKSVLCIIADKSGNIWFGTENMGLYRYNGQGFSNYRYNGKTWSEKPKDSLAFNDGNYINGIQTMMVRKNGDLWFSSIGSGGVFRFDGENFHNIREKALNKSEVFCLMEDKKNNIWLGTREHGVFKYDGKSFTNYNQKDGFCFKNITCITEDKLGKIWFGSTQFDEMGKKEGCITLFDGNAFKRFPTEGLINTSVWSIFQDKNDNIWLGMRGLQLYRFNIKGFTNFTDLNAT